MGCLKEDCDRRRWSILGRCLPKDGEGNVKLRWYGISLTYHISTS